MPKKINLLLEQIMQEYNCGYAKAKYIRGKQKRGEAYKPHASHFSKITQEDVKDFYPVVLDGQKVVLKKNGNKITVLTPKLDCTGHLRFLLHGSRSIMFASLVWLKNNPDKYIPDGYVINHKDLNPQNDYYENLECIPATENTDKNHRNASNQYIKNN